ncbi:MAG: RNA polymerase sigma factor [Candidatus Pacebacteria bacterium]|nr:RNA polymerase sigma factor [Candidatus Paceibacterota bacterium]
MQVEKEFTQAYEEYADSLFRHCYFRVSSRERALEITQEAFMKTWDTANRGTEIQNYRAFLFRVLNNLIIDEYRKKKSSSLDALLEKEGVNEGHFDELQTGGLEEEIGKIELNFQSGQLEQALKKLPETYRTVVVMRYINELRPSEIADILNESENTVSVRINRGLKKLREHMPACAMHADRPTT